jgi:hypothetical protein
MTIREFIKYLETFDQEMPIVHCQESSEYGIEGFDEEPKVYVMALIRDSKNKQWLYEYSNVDSNKIKQVAVI